MASRISICNQAMMSLGAGNITSLDEGSAEAIACNAVFDQVLDSVLRMHPWNCAVCIAEVAADASAPVIGYLYRYHLPADPYCLRPLRVMDEAGAEYRFRVVGRYVESDCAAPAYVEYIKRVTAVGDLDSMLVDAVAARLAMELAPKFPGGIDQRDFYAQEYSAKIAMARQANSSENNQVVTVNSSFLDPFDEE